MNCRKSQTFGLTNPATSPWQGGRTGTCSRAKASSPFEFEESEGVVQEAGHERVGAVQKRDEDDEQPEGQPDETRKRDTETEDLACEFTRRLVGVSQLAAEQQNCHIEIQVLGELLVRLEASHLSQTPQKIEGVLASSGQEGQRREESKIGQDDEGAVARLMRRRYASK